MHNDQQFEQLMLQYEQLKNGSVDIAKMIEEEDYDGALTLIKSRESVFLNCKCMRKFLDLTPSQEKRLNLLLDEISELEMKNIKTLSQNMDTVKNELKKTQKTEKIQKAYTFGEGQSGSIINIQE